MENSRMNLLPFAPAAARDALFALLQRLGDPVIVSDFQRPREVASQSRRRIAICLFGQRSLTEDRDATLAVLARWAALPRLGLFMGDHSGWDSDIVFACNEFSQWPCSEGELAMRLRRLGVGNGEAKAAPRRLGNDLIDLNLIGESPSFLNAIDRLKRFTRCDATVLIEGETGTGKELAARAVHYLSERREHPFIPVNCGTLPDALLENELFGHTRGAFTDARESTAGLIAHAEQGTLFLDEVESLSPRAQVALLRFLQEMEYRPVGSPRTLRANVRVIAATNLSLEAMAAQGHFRPDLLYRLKILPVCLPALRERADDVLLLAEHFLTRLRRRYGQPDRYLHEDFIAWMRSHDWPGNIRELENLLHRQFLLAEESAIRMNPAIAGDSSAPSPPGAKDGGFAECKARVIEAFERDYLTRLVAQSGGNVTQAALHAGKERRAFGKLLKKHGIETHSGGSA